MCHDIIFPSWRFLFLIGFSQNNQCFVFSDDLEPTCNVLRPPFFHFLSVHRSTYARPSLHSYIATFIVLFVYVFFSGSAIISSLGASSYLPVYPVFSYNGYAFLHCLHIHPLYLSIVLIIHLPGRELVCPYIPAPVFFFGYLYVYLRAPPSCKAFSFVSSSMCVLIVLSLVFKFSSFAYWFICQ